MKKRITITLVALLALAVAAQAATIPAGTKVSVRLNQELESGKNKAGDSFEGVLEQPVVVGGKTIAPRGAAVRGKVITAKDSGRLHKPGYISIALTAVHDIRVHTTVVGRQGKSHTKSNATKIGGGAAAGALIGGLAGGGKGALIGSAVGAGAGTGTAYATGKKDVAFEAERRLTFRLNDSVKVNR